MRGVSARRRNRSDTFEREICMAVTVHIPTPLRQHTEGQPSVPAAGATVQAILADLGTKYPGISQRLFDNGKVRPFINLYLNDEDIRYLDNLATPVKDGDDLAIIPAVAGG
jgi:molybdopterin converting factor small subunit